MINLTDNAIRRIREVMDQETKTGLRLGVRGGGCSGLSYVTKYETDPPRPSDRVFEYDRGVKIWVDPKSYVFLEGLTLDWKNTLMEQGFIFTNPNATKSCGCGTSFS